MIVVLKSIHRFGNYDDSGFRILGESRVGVKEKCWDCPYSHKIAKSMAIICLAVGMRRERCGMNRQRSLKEYRTIDLLMFGAMLVVCEFLVVKAATTWFPGQLYTISLAGAIVSIVYMRWGWWGCIHAFLAGFVFCLANNAHAVSYLVYCVGNLLSCLSLFPLLKLGKERVRTGSLSLMYPLLVLFLMQTGRALVALLTGASLSAVAGFYLTDSLSYVFTFVVAWIASRLDGIYEDQVHFLLRLSAKERTEKGGS